MDKSTVLEHFGGVVATAGALGISRQSVWRWPDLVPELRAIAIERITDGEIVYDWQRYQTSDVA